MAHHHQCHLHYLNNSAGWTNHVVMLFVNRRQHEQPRLRKLRSDQPRYHQLGNGSSRNGVNNDVGSTNEESDD